MSRVIVIAGLVALVLVQEAHSGDHQSAISEDGRTTVSLDRKTGGCLATTTRARGRGPPS
jgi:hypothetical protein